MTQGIFGLVAGIAGVIYFVLQFFHYLDAHTTQN